MGHHDRPPVEHEVPGPVQRPQPLLHGGGVGTQLACEVGDIGRAAGGGERPVHGKPQVLVIHRTSLAPFFSNDTATTEIYTLSLHDAARAAAERDELGA